MIFPRKVFGTKEWARRTANYIEGCWHDCRYCYAKSIPVSATLRVKCRRCLRCPEFTRPSATHSSTQVHYLG